MGISGRCTLKDHSLEEIEQAFIENYGRVKEVSKLLGVRDHVLYNLLDIYPELQEARKKGSKMYLERKVETADEVLDKIIAKVESDPTNAGKQANFILKNAKNSPYYESKEVVNEGATIEEVKQFFGNSKSVSGTEKPT
tara:strand:+ start:252 stop:668 length:417 start_codon:yes stop_codon:yes gene_type:complete